MTKDGIGRYLPLTETTYYILLALSEPRHGYAIMQHTTQVSAGRVKLGPGTLYGAITKLLAEKIIIPQAGGDAAGERRKIYVLTELGRQVLQAEYNRLLEMVRYGATVMPRALSYKEKK
jgi:DNA-binding PadR family transcriptional regulator